MQNNKVNTQLVYNKFIKKEKLGEKMQKKLTFEKISGILGVVIFTIWLLVLADIITKDYNHYHQQYHQEQQTQQKLIKEQEELINQQNNEVVKLQEEINF